MTNEEFNNEFDVLYNSITSNQAPGLDEYEKSVFLTKAQEEIILQYFNPKGNKFQEGFDGSRKRQIDFRNLLKSFKLSKEDRIDLAQPDVDKFDSRSIVFPTPGDLFLFINETLSLSNNEIRIVHPISMDEYTIYMQKPFQYPPKKYVWRLLNNYYLNSNISIKTGGQSSVSIANIGKNIVKIDYTVTTRIPGDDTQESITTTENSNIITISGRGSLQLLTDECKKYNIQVFNWAGDYADRLVHTISYPSTMVSGVELIGFNIKNSNTTDYTIKYIKRPNPIIVDTLPDNLTIRGKSEKSECELDPSIHWELLQRAVELAKAVYQGNLDTQIAIGSNSQTNLGIIPQSNNSK